MAIVIHCPACRTKLTVGDDRAGETFECPRCDEIVKIPRSAPPPSPARSRYSPRPPARVNDKEDEETDIRPRIDFPGAFVWWQRRSPGRTFPFHCPDCGTTVKLRQRVTQTKRTCPGCGFQITVKAIDRQLEEWEAERQRIMNSWGCSPAMILLFIGVLGVGTCWVL